MKFYIATSNLNLDNILQSECILPPLHYSRRCSGYKTYEQLDELRSIESIVLFKYPVKFNINDMGRYNFPMLIEFEDDSQTYDFSEKEIQSGVCLCGHRLNITPKNCRIYFFNERAYKLTLVNTRSNKSIKYYKEYEIFPSTSMLKLEDMPTIKSSANDISKFEDNILDKQKGLLYAFLLGNKMSVNRNLAKQLRITQELYNILTNLIFSPSNYNIFSIQLSNFINDYKDVDPIESNYSKLFYTNFDNAIGKRFLFLKERLVDFLKKIDCWDIVFESLCKKWNCSFLPDVSKLKTENDFSFLRNEIERRTRMAQSEYSKKIPNENLSNIHISGDQVTYSDAKLINIVIKYIIENSVTPDILSAKRMEFYMEVMTKIVSILKDDIGEEKWQESLEKAYVNRLYAFINDPTITFNINSIENVELKSIAVFILKGYSFKDCVAYLRLNEIEDYRYVLALWGCLCGYMEMSKDALSEILTMENYKLVYKKIFGTELTEITQATIISFTQEKSIDYNLLNQILEVFKYKESELLIDSISKCNPSEDSIEECLNEILNRNPFKRAGKQCENARQALKIYLKRDNKIDITGIVEETTLSKTGKKAICNLLGFDESKTNKKSEKKTEQPDLFVDTDIENDKESVKDGTNLNVMTSSYKGQTISALSDEVFPSIPIANQINSNVRKRLEENWKFTGEKYKNDRREHIRFFINLCKKEGRGDSQKTTSLFHVFTTQLAEQVERELLDYYGFR